MTARDDRCDQFFADMQRRAAVLADVTNLTDAYRLKVLEDAAKELRKSMAKRGSAVSLCTSGEPDHDGAS